MNNDIQTGYADETGDMPLTRAFLEPGAKIYKRGVYFINTLVMAGMVYSFLSYTQSSSPNYVPPVPDAPAAAVNFEPLPGMERIPRPPARPAITGDRLGEFTELDVPGINTYDADGVYSVSSSVSHTVRGAGHIIGPVTAEMFGVDDFDISDEILRAIQSASKAEGVPTFIMLTFAELESSFRPWEEADTSSAAGLFQITIPTLQGLLMRLGESMGYDSYAKQVGYANEQTYWRDAAAGAVIENMRLDPKHASRWAARLHVDNTQRIQNQVGRSLEPVEYYISHFMGAKMAPKFLRAVDRTPTSQVDGSLWAQQIDANETIFRNEDGGIRTYAEVMDYFDKRVGPVMARYALLHEEPGSEGYNWGVAWSREHGVIDVYQHGPEPDVEAEMLAARF